MGGKAIGRLAGKIAVITGAAHGIGFAIAKGFASEGAEVFMGDIDAGKGEAAAKRLRDTGGKATFKVCDVTKEDQVASLVNAAADAGRGLHVMVNNAARAIGGMPLHEMIRADWDTLILTNLTSVYLGCRYALPHMIEGGSGSIINIGSVQGHVGIDGWGAYAGAKGAIMSMSRQMAVEYGKHNIRVNTISPGTINTPMNARVAQELGEHLKKTWVLMHPIGRIGEPEEIAEAAVYLASDSAGFTTGLDLVVDGGLSITPRFVPELFQDDEG